MGNSIVHVLLVAICYQILIISPNTGQGTKAWRNRGPVFLALLNFAAGYFALQGWRMPFR